MNRRRYRLLPVFALLLALIGCGDGKSTISGKVTLNGKSLTSGTVLMVGSDGFAATGVIGSDGSYKIDGIKAGEVKVAVNCPNPKSMRGPDESSGRGLSKGKGATTADAEALDAANWFPIPARYSDPETSGIKTTLKSGSNSYDIELK